LPPGGVQQAAEIEVLRCRGKEKAMLMVMVVAMLVMGVAIVVGCTRAVYS
jgi:hypothetical protein